MSERLTRKEIKRDEFVEALETSVGWVEQNSKLLIAGGVAVLLLIAAGFGIFFWLEARSASASAALDEALEAYRAPVGEAAEGLDEDEVSYADEAARREGSKQLFQVVVDDYGSSDPAAVARVFLGQIAAEEGDLDRARELWSESVDSLGDEDLLADQVRVNLIHLERQQGGSEAVAVRLEEMIADEERPLPGDLVLWELAATYEDLGRDDDAEATYRRLTEEYPSSAFASQASQKLPQEAGGPQQLTLGGGLG